MKKNNPVLASVKSTIRKHTKTFLIMIFMIILSVVTSLIPPLVMERAINILSEEKTIPVLLAATYLFFIILQDTSEMGQNAWITIFGQKITHGLRSSLASKLNLLPSSYYTEHDAGKTASVFVNDTDAVDSLFSNGIVGMAADAAKLFSILIVIFTRSPGLGLVLLAVTPLLFLLTRLFQKRTLKAQMDNRKAIAKVNNHVPETIRCIRMIHVFKKERYMEDKYDDYIIESYEAVNRSNFYDSVYSPIIIITQALLIALLMTGAVQGEAFKAFFGLSVGSAVAVISYVGKIFSPLESIGMEIQNIQEAVSGIKRINDFLSESETEDKSNDCKGKKGIVFDNVTFGYKKDMPILRDCSFEISSGENVTFIGRTGAGKSTIFKLLMGLYQAEKGSVTIDGVSPLHIKPTDRRRIFGIVEQDFRIVKGSVREQVSLFDKSIGDDMIWKALDTVKLSRTIRNLEHGLDEDMKENIFSKGQLQLLSIARAIVMDPSILLLDEITANLDSETEEQVLNALVSASKGRTVLSISHRYSTMMKNQRQISVGSSFCKV